MPRTRDILIVGILTSTVVLGSMMLMLPKKEQIVDLVCGNEIILSGVDTNISAAAFGNGVLWSVPTDSGIALVHWQDKYSHCEVRRSYDYQE